MNNVIEMFKWMAIGFAACGVVALVLIFIARLMKRFSANPEPPPSACPCGRKASCLQADHLGVCNTTSGLRFIRNGALSNRPSLWWVAGVALFIFAFSSMFTGWGPIRGISVHPLFPFALGLFVWSYVIRIFRKHRNA